MYSLLSFTFFVRHTQRCPLPLYWLQGYSSCKTWFVVLQSNSKIARFKQNSAFFAKMKNFEV